jgi:V/A-type H+-transporting ATPase subunit B
VHKNNVLIQVFGECRGLDVRHTTVVFTDAIKQTPLSPTMLNRVFSGSMHPLDGRDMFVPDRWWPTGGFPLNPTLRDSPREFIETGISAIDGLTTLVKGQKLPIFSGSGLPAHQMVADILNYARTSSGHFVVIFVALGLTLYEYDFYMSTLAGLATHHVAIINLASDSVLERLLAPRFGLTVAEYFAFQQGMDALVVITDMTNYCDALREISSAREELPGRRGYPGYMYSDLASLFERAGRIKGRPGSVTLLPVVTMPEDDITHPIPDLTGYITEGQIVLSREMHQQGLYPPVDVLPSLSRLMQHGIGEGLTRKDHRQVANDLYRQYARGRDLRGLAAIVGREGMTESDRRCLDFCDGFEREFVQQTDRRSVQESLDLGKELLSRLNPL